MISLTIIHLFLYEHNLIKFSTILLSFTFSPFLIGCILAVLLFLLFGYFEMMNIFDDYYNTIYFKHVIDYMKNNDHI